MKKFTKIVETLTQQKYFEVTSEVKLIVKSENEGEAGYLADSILASVENNYNYTIQLIEDTNDKIDD